MSTESREILFYIYFSYTFVVFRQYIVTQMCDSTSKQNLETIVEAIRHLEGDHLFSEESGPHQVSKLLYGTIFQCCGAGVARSRIHLEEP
jgi:hypothetical protein